MDANQYVVIFYLLFWAVRIRGCVRRGRQPLLRGPEWFFDVPVQAGFYSGEGRRILHRYWMRMLIPFALDIPLAIVILRSGHLKLLNWLILGLCAVIHINHSVSVELAERQARALGAADEPVGAMMLSLNARRLRDYTNWKVEWALALSTLVALAWLVHLFLTQSLTAPMHQSPLLLFGVPALMLYLQIGFLFVKSLVVAWRMPVPELQAAEHLEAREETRKFYLQQCDWNRAAVAASTLFWPVLIGTSGAYHDRLVSFWVAAWLVIAVVAAVRVEIRRKQLIAVALRARPVRLPDFLHQSGLARWPVCYQPSAPMLMLKGAHGYSLNLANTFTQFGAAYVTGLVMLFAALPLLR